MLLKGHFGTSVKNKVGGRTKKGHKEINLKNVPVNLVRNGLD